MMAQEFLYSTEAWIHFRVKVRVRVKVKVRVRVRARFKARFKARFRVWCFVVTGEHKVRVRVMIKARLGCRHKLVLSRGPRGGVRLRLGLS